MRALIEQVAVLAPGLDGWAAAREVLAGRSSYVPQPLPRLAPALLAPDLRRRVSDHIRFAVEAASQAMADRIIDAPRFATVFGSADGDGAITHHICEEVSKAVPAVSPTRFHNSVTNAPAGYWHLAAQSRAPSTSLAAGDATVAACLTEAMMQLATDAVEGVLLVAHDWPLPEPLHRARMIVAPFAAGFRLVRASSRSLAEIECVPASGAVASRLPDGPLETLRTGNAAARALPLLAALAQGGTQTVVLPATGDAALQVTVRNAC
jgi:hypothetical protein